MKYFRGTRKRRTTSARRKSDAEKSLQKSTSVTDDGDEQQRSEESLQTSSDNRSQRLRGRKRAIPNLQPEEPAIKKSRSQQSSNSKNKSSASNKERENDAQDMQSHDQKELKKKAKSTKKAGPSTRRKPSTRTRNASTASVNTAKSASTKKSKRKAESDSETEADLAPVHCSSLRVAKDKTSKSSNRQSASAEEQQIVNSSSEISDSAFENNEDEIHVPTSKTQPSCSGSMEEVVLSGDNSSLTDGSHSDREFLQQQVKLLMSPFDISDCPEIPTRGTKRQQKNHISTDIISKSLRKLNYKVEDELLKTLNRQAQRRIIHQIQEIRSHKALESTHKSDNGVELPGDRNNLESLKKMLESSEEELNGLKDLNNRALKLESLIEEVDANSLSEEIKQTNKLLKQMQDKIKKQGFPESSVHVPVTNTTMKGPFSHHEIVNQLFPK